MDGVVIEPERSPDVIADDLDEVEHLDGAREFEANHLPIVNHHVRRRRLIIA
jgi:hypothetical protein